MRTELVSIPTPTVALDGALHRPDEGQPVRGGVLLFHGNTMNFYTGAPRFLPPVLTRLGLTCLAFNRRGHDILSIRDSRAAEGAAFQTYAEALEDDDLAAAWFAERGFATPIVIGHSNGGTLGVQFAAHHPETRALVLLSAHRGGAEMLRLASATGLLAGDVDRFDAALADAEARLAAGRGEELLVLPGWWYVLTARSFVDAVRNMPDTLATASRVRCPTLFVRGEREPAHLYPLEEYQARSGGACETVLVPGADHFYKGAEAETARLVADWLGRLLGEPQPRSPEQLGPSVGEPRARV